MRRPLFWILFLLLSAAAAAVAIHYFPRAFSIVSLEITMDRERALEAARTIAARDGIGPPGALQAASFALDDEAQRFVELEGGGKEAFTAMLRERLYSAYTWRVRHFAEGEPREATIRFTPDGTPYGFVEKLREDAPGAAIDGTAAREIAERSAARWNVDLSTFQLVEQGQERRTAGRLDHTLIYERPSPTLNEGRYRLRLVVSGDRLTEVTHLIRVPEAFTRRYQHMRAANDAIGIGSAVALSLLYVFGGIGVGLFYMLRSRWLLWRHAVFWGMAVAALQTLNQWNQLPLLWMDYDTAIARSTFLASHAANAVAGFAGFSVFFSLSFMAAESLTRRAFGRHPQLWRVWSGSASGGGAVPGASIAILGRTMAGYLLAPVFLAYIAVFYYLAFRYLGWWSPSEMLLHPDVLATYMPWLSAISNSFQAGFWEEALFRAVPLAGAALIGERLGHRRPFLIGAFIVQAAVFGAGHAQYPGQPAYARPVELMLPSIGFGLLYLYFGLLPAIVLHFVFDVVLFSLPVFLAGAPRIWIQQLLVAAAALVPLWIVIWRRVRAGEWTELAAADLNAAWTPPPPPQLEALEEVTPRAPLGGRVRKAWIVVGAASFAGCAGSAALIWTSGSPSMPVDRLRAASLARGAVEARGATLDRRWRVLPRMEAGLRGAHEFVAITAGQERRRELNGRYLPAPHWHVRIATFEGDVADRAEEWSAAVTSSGEVQDVRHVLPEARAGARLDEGPARELARRAIAERFGLQAGRGDVTEASNRPARLSARTDWTFIFTDRTIPPLPEGEPRIAIGLAGDEIASVSRFVHIPEHWQRQQRAAGTRNLIIRVAGTMILAGLLLAASIHGVIRWGRRQYAPRLFFAGAALMFVSSLARSANMWPELTASLSTAAPLELQLLGVIGIGLVGLILSAAMVGLALGAMPHRLAAGPSLQPREVLKLGMAAGSFAAIIGMTSEWLRTPEWARVPNFGPAGAMLPMVQAAIDPAPRLLLTSAIILTALLLTDYVTAGWTRRRLRGALILLAVGFAGAGVPAGIAVSGWVAAGFLSAATLILLYASLLRYDLTMVPIALGTMTAVGSIARAAARAFPDALTGSLLAAMLALVLAWWLSRSLARARRRLVELGPGAPARMEAASSHEHA